jgi:hypothetical protein
MKEVCAVFTQYHAWFKDATACGATYLFMFGEKDVGMLLGKSNGREGDVGALMIAHATARFMIRWVIAV